MKRILMLLTFLGLMLVASAQDTIYVHQIIRTPCVRKVVMDTMPAKVVTDKKELGLKGNVKRVESRTMDYVTCVVMDETFDLDDYGYIVRSVSKMGGMEGDRNQSMNDIGLEGAIQYSNVVTMNNVYQKGKICKIEVEDKVRGKYQIHYRYDLSGNVIGHDTVYNGEHHKDYTARFDRYHNPSFVKDHTGTFDEYSIKYQYAPNVRDMILEKMVEKYNVVTQASTTAHSKYTYNELNQLALEVTESDQGATRIEYSYDDDGNVVSKRTQTTAHVFEETMERDSHGSIISKKVTRDGKTVLQVYNKITYGSADTQS